MCLNIVDDLVNILEDAITFINKTFNELIGNSITSALVFITALCFVALLLNLLVGKK